MIELKQNSAAKVPVRLVDNTGVPVVGVPISDVTLAVCTSSGTEAVVSPEGWQELTQGPFINQGIYILTLPSSSTSNVGLLLYAARSNVSETYRGAVKVVGAEMGELDAKLVRALGMLHENSVLDMTSFDGKNNMTSGRLRLYGSKANAEAAQAVSPNVYDTGKLAQYSIIATYVGSNLTSYTMLREA